MKSKLGSRLVDVGCGFVAYIGARLIWSGQPVLENLLLELLTFAVLFLVRQAIVRGRRLAKVGRQG